MRIAQVAPVFESVPPQRYGGTERVVSYLTEELVRLGHDVTLFATGDSLTSAHLESTSERALRYTEAYLDSIPYQILHLQRVIDLSPQFDVIHYHIDYIHFPISRKLQVPQLTTLHGRLDLPSLKNIYSEYDDMPLVSISLEQRKPLGQGPLWIGNVYHGLPSKFGLTPGGSRDYLAFLGRVSPEKRLDRAIEISENAGLPLKVAAKIDVSDRPYYEQKIKPLMNKPHVEFIGEIGEREKEGFLKNAKALLFPIDWPEPFGLVMIEAMACGTPVIAYGHGSVPEIIKNGTTGFIVRSIDEAVECVHRLNLLDSNVIRKEFESRFSVERMAQDYLDTYKKLNSAQDRAKKEFARRTWVESAPSYL
jgi:glycosyltransferase involved in cell wall biosynthesis